MALTYTLKNNAGGKLKIVNKSIKSATSLSTGIIPYILTATDETGWSKDFTSSITIKDAPIGPLSVVYTPFAATVDRIYRLTPVITGGKPPFTFNYTGTGSIPVGYDFAPDTGEITGLTGDVGQYANLKFTITDSSPTPKVVESNIFSITVGDQVTPNTITYLSTAVAGTPIVDFAGLITNERILSTVPNDGRIAITSGGLGIQVGTTPSTVGSATYTFTTSLNRTFNTAFRISNDTTAPIVAANINITIPEGQDWSLLLSTVTDDPTAVWAIKQGKDSDLFTLDDGLTIKFAAADFDFPLDDNEDHVNNVDLQVTDSNENSSFTTLNLTVSKIVENAAPINTVLPSISGDDVVGGQLSVNFGTWQEGSPLTGIVGSPPNGQVGTNYSGVSVQASGGTAPYTYVVKSGGVAGLAINTSTGMYGLNQKPTTEATYNALIFTITDSSTPAQTFDTSPVSIVIAAAPATPAPTPLVQDSISVAPTVYFSLRKTRNGYNGPCIKVRRSLDNTTMEIGFDSNGVLDTTALTQFCGTLTSSAGYVDTWYDQSLNGLHAFQTNTSLQPIIFNAGTTILAIGKPNINFANTQGLKIPMPGGAAKRSVRMVANHRNTGNATLLRSDTAGGWDIRFASTTRYLQLLKQGASVIAGTTVGAPGANIPVTLAVDYDSSNYTLNIDGVSAVSGVNAQTVNTPGTAFNMGLTSTCTMGLQSVIVFDGVIIPQADTDIIQSRQKAYYGTA